MEGGLGVFKQLKGEQLRARSSASRLVPAKATKAGLASQAISHVNTFYILWPAVS